MKQPYHHADKHVATPEELAALMAANEKHDTRMGFRKAEWGITNDLSGGTVRLLDPTVYALACPKEHATPKEIWDWHRP
jgi:hypothetical protein